MNDRPRIGTALRERQRFVDEVCACAYDDVGTVSPRNCPGTTKRSDMEQWTGQFTLPIERCSEDLTELLVQDNHEIPMDTK